MRVLRKRNKCFVNDDRILTKFELIFFLWMCILINPSLFELYFLLIFFIIARWLDYQRSITILSIKCLNFMVL